MKLQKGCSMERNKGLFDGTNMIHDSILNETYDRIHFEIFERVHPLEIDHCLSSPCQNGYCNSQPGGYVCKCKEGFTGKQCESGEM